MSLDSRAVIFVTKSDKLKSDWVSCLDAGEVRWHQFRPSGLPIAEPALSVPDVDGDDVSDVVLVAYDSTQVNGRSMLLHSSASISRKWFYIVGENDDCELVSRTTEFTQCLFFLLFFSFWVRADSGAVPLREDGFPDWLHGGSWLYRNSTPSSIPNTTRRLLCATNKRSVCITLYI